MDPKNQNFLLQGTLEHGKLSFDLQIKEPSIRHNVWAICITSLTLVYPSTSEQNLVFGLKANYVENSKYVAIASFSKAAGSIQTTHLPVIWYEIDFPAKKFEILIYDLQTDKIYNGPETCFIQVVYHRKA